MAKKKSKNPLYYTIPMDVSRHFSRMLDKMLAEDKVKGLIGYLMSRFPKDMLDMAIERYRLGICDKKTMIYPYIDVENRLRCLKRMKYGEDGKRCRNGGKSAGVGYICASLKEQGVIPASWSPKQCLFGEHLLSMFPEAPVVIVESEKSAVVCSMFFPEYVWLATGGCGQIKPIVWISQRLSQRKVLLFPDTGEYDFWKQKAKKHSLKCRVSNFMEFGNREWNTDLADLLLSDSHELYVDEVKLYLELAFNRKL